MRQAKPGRGGRYRYQIDAEGKVLLAKIVPPTSQNLRQIEDDLRAFVEGHLDLPDDRLTWQCEQAIRNYDPCRGLDPGHRPAAEALGSTLPAR